MLKNLGIFQQVSFYFDILIDNNMHGIIEEDEMEEEGSDCDENFANLQE